LYNQAGSLVNVWTNIAELPQMKPVYTTEFTTRGHYSYIEFKSGVVTGSWTGAQKEIQVNKFDIKLEQPVFDWSLYGVLLAALPFEQGKIFKIPIFDGIQSTNPVGFLIADIVGQKLIGRYNTWEIKTNQNLVFWSQKKNHM
ncbi:MAG: hypothetical protein KDD94_11680, partial [Calditrichaeota bacterium]|nr:hypothetical protein [Calditrichota bacterium]